MNLVSRLRSKAAGFLAHLLATSLVVCAAGIAPAMAASVTVDQSPLIIQRSLPPNLVLMLDDSGSMDNDYMPDKLDDTSIDGFRNSGVNGTYYNPDSKYVPPPKAAPKADGSTDYYPNSPSLGAAYKDGFQNISTIDVTRYSGEQDYFTRLNTTETTTYTATPVCPNNYAYKSSSGKCERKNYTDRDPTWTCLSGDIGPGGSTQTCTTAKKYFFTYTTGSKGAYAQHYVGKTGDCALLTSSSDKASCDESATTQQNVANWFSYYRTRILMAKSGVMSSFSALDASFRVGFGSINNSNSADVKVTGKYTSDYNDKFIAQVQPFGTGSSGSQKDKLWNWVVGIKPSGNTPLRPSLDAIGKYYKSDQPWAGMSSDPDSGTAAAGSELACRQSYTILTTDGYWNEPNGFDNGPGDVDGVTGPKVTNPNGPDTITYKVALPYADSGNTTAVTDVQTATCSAGYTLTAGNPYYCKKSGSSNKNPGCSSGYTLNANKNQCSKTTPGVTYTDTLADVAMQYWSTDLRPDTKNEVPTNAEDPAFWQHMTTFTLGMGFTPEYADGSKIPMEQVFAWANGDASKAISNFAWPKPVNNTKANIADLAHAAVNGHGGFYSASNPESFANGLKEALKRAAERVGTGASLAANSTQLQTGTVAYQANYWTAKWKGDLKALAVDSSTGAIASSATWTASGKLPTVADRKIKTFNPDAAAGSQFVEFKVATDGTLPSLAGGQHTALSTVNGTATSEADLINYLRGDGSKEQSKGGSYRNRDNAVGDIVNSQPVYVGAPNANQFYTESFSGSTAFTQYASDKSSRAGTVYVAANDGMLHGVDAATGAEKFAYLPGAVITNGLSGLASPDYGGAVAHGFFNDGELTVADVYMGSPASWKTVLVGTTGRGVARAVYALDVTDPADVKFLWERSAGDGNTNSASIGQMTGKPVIAQTANGSWSVLLGNGYNSGGNSALLQFELDTGILHVHATTDGSGLAAPAVWMDPSGNGISTVAYAGDANGNVWSFPLNDSTGSAATATPDSAGTKIFVAKDGSGNAQPITAGLLIGKDPATGNTWVFFGTGRYLSTADLGDASVQSWYGLIVQSGTSGLAVTSGMTRAANLVQRSITAEAGNGRAVTTLGEAAAANASINGKSGWYMDLKSPVAGAEGERMVTPNQFQGNLLLGTTRIPKATDPCNPSGKGWIMALDPFTGTNPSQPFFDLNGDGKVDDNDTVDGKPAAGIGFSSLPNNPIFVGSAMLTSFDNGTTSSTQTAGSTGSLQRVSWRELIAR